MKIREYKDYDVLDFVEDDNFRKWCQTRDKSLDFFWSAYSSRYPHQKEKLEEAKMLVTETHMFFDDQAQKLPIPDLAREYEIKSELRDTRSKAIKGPYQFKAIIYQLAIACSILLIIGFSYSLLQDDTQAQIHYETGHAEWKQVTLPDGSEVELNANTQLWVTDEWEKGVTRRVWLKGEAFFKVKKLLATNAKFTVITKDLEVDVLGTTFNVNTRNDQTEVFLEEGKITLDMQGKVEEIEPGEFISYSGTTKKIINRYQKTEEIHSNWKDGVLKITDAPMSEILSEIETIYGIDLIVKEKTLLEKVHSVAIPVDDIEMASSILERVLNVKMVQKGKQIFIN